MEVVAMIIIIYMKICGIYSDFTKHGNKFTRDSLASSEGLLF